MPTAKLTFLLVAVAALSPLGAQAYAEAGTPVDNVELRTLAGGKERLLSAKARANVMVFFRPNQERSTDALKQMAKCEKDLAGKPVHWVAVVSSSSAPEEVRSVVQETGIRMPVLVDEGDALYDKLGIRLHPMIAIADARFKLVAVEQYRQLDYCDIIEGRIKVVLGEMQQAELDKIVNPERSGLPGEDLPKKAMRDVNMARKLLEMDLFDKAIERCKRALEIAPVAAAYSMMGDVYAKQGNCDEAKRQYAQALKLDAKDARALDGQGKCR